MGKGGEKMARIFVMSDVHGQQTAFFEVLRQAQFNETDVLYILGDLIDRGPDGIALLQYVQQQPNIHLLMGNHEELMCRSLQDEWGVFECWIGNGGTPTYETYLKLPKDEQQSIRTYLEELPLYQELTINGEHYLLVHAGLCYDENLPWDLQLAQQTRDDLLWIRTPFLSQSWEDSPFTVVHGHTPTLSYGKYKACSPTREGISIELKRIGLDCGAGHLYQLGLYCLTDQTSYYYTWKI